MARRHSTTPIPPFPPEIDRDAFGHWLSGFVDGEGCFFLGWNRVREKHTPVARFRMNLRADDRPALELVMRFWQCGQIRHQNHTSSASRKRRPVADYYISSAPDLAQVIIPHFDKYHLRSKKQKDFAIWKPAVQLCHLVISIPSRKRLGVNTGWESRWNRESIEEFESYFQALRSQREYQSPTIEPIRARRKKPDEPTLFD